MSCPERGERRPLHHERYAKALAGIVHILERDEQIRELLGNIGAKKFSGSALLAIGQDVLRRVSDEELVQIKKQYESGSLIDVEGLGKVPTGVAENIVVLEITERQRRKSEDSSIPSVIKFLER